LAFVHVFALMMMMMMSAMQAAVQNKHHEFKGSAAFCLAKTAGIQEAAVMTLHNVKRWSGMPIFICLTMQVM
jgi:hypothetical protein